MEQINSHFEIAGEGKTVAVLYGPAIAWGPIWPELTGLTKVSRYDRGGLLPPHSAFDIVIDMRVHLKKADAAAPYILIGHSFGGMLMQLFARMFPDEVKALVLIDSVHENQVARFYEFSQEAGNGLEAEIAEVLIGIDYGASEKQLQAAPPLRRDLSLTVISRGKETNVAKVWLELQIDLVRQSDKSDHIIAANSGHGIQFDEPEVVVSAIRKAIQRMN